MKKEKAFDIKKFAEAHKEALVILGIVSAIEIFSLFAPPIPLLSVWNAPLFIYGITGTSFQWYQHWWFGPGMYLLLAVQVFVYASILHVFYQLGKMIVKNKEIFRKALNKDYAFFVIIMAVVQYLSQFGDDLLFFDFFNLPFIAYAFGLHEGIRASVSLGVADFLAYCVIALQVFGYAAIVNVIYQAYKKRK